DDRVTHPVVSYDILEPAQEEGAVEVTYEMLGDLRDQGHRIIATRQQSAVMLERISELEPDIMRLRGMLDVARMEEVEMEEETKMEMVMEIEEMEMVEETAMEMAMEMVMGTKEEMVITLEVLYLLLEYTYQDFLKCQPLNFNGTEGVVGLTRWYEKMGTVFHISKCPQKFQVKYATCTLLNSALTWWNSHKRTVGVDA
ncbi:hypothetical protein Tco_1048664, partial [Tanacetum coccineum]